ncbi:hypothetical protein [Snuella lapsa]|uniref:Uncharacterized protein n=1 Tax=Snuella lapsa TaxID=870481 RepID=A0ABP6YFF5_9FLAO
MKAASIVNIKHELKHKSNAELEALCLRLAKFKIENKELLTYLLFESHDENGYIETVRDYMDEQFELINTSSFFFIKKSVRKILRNKKKYIRYSQNKETEVELLLHFCYKLKHFSPSINKSVQLVNMYQRQLQLAKKIITTLHEDLQYDYSIKLENL